MPEKTVRSVFMSCLSRIFSLSHSSMLLLIMSIVTCIFFMPLAVVLQTLLLLCETIRDFQTQTFPKTIFKNVLSIDFSGLFQENGFLIRITFFVGHKKIFSSYSALSYRFLVSTLNWNAWHFRKYSMLERQINRFCFFL
jgi:hypothetical protein